MNLLATLLAGSILLINMNRIENQSACGTWLNMYPRKAISGLTYIF